MEEADSPLPRRLLKQVRSRSRKLQSDTNNWLKLHCPDWVVTVMKWMDELTNARDKCQRFLSMPHFQKLLWALTLFVFGVSGFCVSSSELSNWA